MSEPQGGAMGLEADGSGDYSLDFEIRHAQPHDACVIHFVCFDTHNVITLYGRDDAETLLLQARDMCLHLHMLLSPALPASDIARLNTSDALVRVAPETAELLSAMRAFSACEPAFDFTIGSLSYRWKRTRHMPDAETLAHAREHVGHDKLHIDGRDVSRDDGELLVDIGAAAKGYAADRIVALFTAAGVTCADIDLGGNLYFIGCHPSGRPWRLDVALPEGLTQEPVVFDTHDCSVVTSSGFERSRTIDGVLCNHIIDPRSGLPADSDIVSATVLGTSSLECDMLATTLLVAGTRELSELVARHPSHDVFAVTREGTVVMCAHGRIVAP